MPILESVGAHTKLILASERITINGTRGSVLRRFDESLLFRANRATAVKLREVSKVYESAVGYIVLTIGNHPPVECSRRQSVEFRRMREI